MLRYCLVVPKDEAEDVRQELLANGMLEKHLKILRQGDFVLFPVRERFESRHSFAEMDFPEAFRPILHYSDVVELPDELKSLLPTSLDFIGDIALVRLPEELNDHGAAVGEAILRAYKNVSCVFADEGVGGEFRIRNLRHLGGEDRTRTVHVEYGLRFAVDVSRAYFSPRLATERVRVTGQVKPGEVVLDLFTGVGPYAIMIAKMKEPSVVYAVDSNPAAFELLEENIRRNRVDRVKAVQADAREYLNTTEKVDRLILDLPQSAPDFYLGALQAVNGGGTLHYYEIMEVVGLENRVEWLKGEAEWARINIDIAGITEVKTYSASQKHYAIDIRVC